MRLKYLTHLKICSISTALRLKDVQGPFLHQRKNTVLGLQIMSQILLLTKSLELSINRILAKA